MSDEPGKTVLDDIIATRWQTLEETRRAVPLDRVQKTAEAREERRDFAAALKPAEVSGAPGVVRVIAELKRASPSRGLLQAALSPPRNCRGICGGRCGRALRV